MALLRSEIRDQWLYRQAQTRSIDWLRRLARRRGKAFGYVYVGGYAKSGTSWIAATIADALGLACPRDYALPPAFRCVVHHHWSPEPFLDGSIYVLRDGRDAMVSEFFSMISGHAAMRARIERFGRTSMLERRLLTRWGRDARLLRRLESALDLDARRGLFARFVEENLTRPWSEVVADSWQEHVRKWLERDVTIVRYEQALADPAATFGAAVDVDDERLRAAIERHDFERISGRPPGDEERTSFWRKGVAGDWRNHFDRESREIFDALAGETLIAAGYESDRGWVDRETPADAPSAGSPADDDR